MPPANPFLTGGGPVPALGTAYFSARVLRHLAPDLRELARSGFTWVNFPLTEQDVCFAPGLAVDLVTAARDAGLEAWLSPWGVGGVFGGEGLSAVAHHGARSPAVADAVARWLACAVAAAPDGLFWDEPRDRLGGGPMGDLLVGWLREGQLAGLTNHVCFEPGYGWPDPAVLAGRVGSVGTDPYDWQPTPAEQAAYVTRHAHALRAYADGAGCAAHLWVRAFRVERGRADLAVAALRAAWVSGAARVGLWSYRAGEGLSCLASEDADGLWARLLEAVPETVPAVGWCPGLACRDHVNASSGEE
ncbi:hypothetical protein V3W47_05270 [Deinococcus sp. YIM 134068]|uniref:hypothetical protein n=1 Tax=Deinococcus lichenicola TaxID=3118910 RepID=UPI002F95CF22